MVKKYRGLFIIGAVIYLFLMIWGMFLQRKPTYNYMLNLVPFKTIKEMISLLDSPYKFNIPFALKNLYGNIFLFSPIGIFLPAIWKKQNDLPIFCLTTAAGIIVAEAVQYFTCLGMGDIDDLILNMTGAIIGFFVFKLFLHLYNKKKGS